MQLSNFINALVAVSVGFITGAVTVQMVAPDLLNQFTEQELPEALTARLVAAGDFRDIDTVHLASGRAQVLESADLNVLRFTNFEVKPGPDLEVWLVRARDIWYSRDVRAIDALSLGPLERTAGDQIYIIPDGIDPAEWRSAIVWSASAKVLFAAADLEP